jgi:hypothetical protein
VVRGLNMGFAVCAEHAALQRRQAGDSRS